MMMLLCFQFLQLTFKIGNTSALGRLLLDDMLFLRRGGIGTALICLVLAEELPIEAGITVGTLPTSFCGRSCLTFGLVGSFTFALELISSLPSALFLFPKTLFLWQTLSFLGHLFFQLLFSKAASLLGPFALFFQPRLLFLCRSLRLLVSLILFGLATLPLGLLLQTLLLLRSTWHIGCRRGDLSSGAESNTLVALTSSTHIAILMYIPGWCRLAFIRFAAPAADWPTSSKPSSSESSLGRAYPA
jgi:hypothetical protein